MYQTFLLDYRVDNILQISLNRGKANAMNMKFFNEILQVFQNVAKDGTIRAVIIKSSLEKFFTAGLDLTELSEIAKFNSCPARDAIAFLNGNVKVMQQAFTAVERCLKPVICALNGFAIGGALDLATACDIRLCSSDAIFSVREVMLGIAADLGTLQRLPMCVGNQSWVRDVCLSGRDFGANEALEFGFVSRVFESYKELHENALKMAIDIASKPPVAVLGTKHLLVHSQDHTIQEGLEYTLLWNSVMCNTPDIAQASMAALSKTRAKYSKL